MHEQGKMEKQVIGSKGLSWQTRTAVLCQHYLSFCKEDDPKEYVIDYIPLHEIQSVAIQEVPSDPVWSFDSLGASCAEACTAAACRDRVIACRRYGSRLRHFDPEDAACCLQLIACCLQLTACCLIA